MADSLLSALTAVSTPADADLFYTVQSATDKKATRAQIVKPTQTTIAASDAAYAPAQNESIILDDVGDNNAINVIFSAVLTQGQQVTIYAADNGGSSHTVKLFTGQTVDGTNNTMTFNAAADFIKIEGVTATRAIIIVNNSVTLSAT
jgi:hypothetical protein